MRARSPHNSSERKYVKVIIISLLLIGVGFAIPKTVSTLSAVVMYPVHVTSVWLNDSSSLIPVFIRDRESLNEQIKALENQLAIEARSSLTQTRLLDENNHLRKLLGIDSEIRIAAAIIARPDELPYDLLQIDRGSDSGVEVGAPVFIGRDTVIGLVVHTASKYSFVKSVTSSGFQATAFISGPNVVVTMEGVGGGVAKVKVPQGVPLAIGNLVYLPSVEPGVFGRISYIENKPTQPEQYGYISPDVSLSSVYKVSVGQLSQLSQSPDEIDQRILDKMQTVLLVPDATIGVLATTSSTTNVNLVP